MAKYSILLDHKRLNRIRRMQTVLEATKLSIKVCDSNAKSQSVLFTCCKRKSRSDSERHQYLLRIVI